MSHLVLLGSSQLIYMEFRFHNGEKIHIILIYIKETKRADHIWEILEYEESGDLSVFQEHIYIKFY